MSPLLDSCGEGPADLAGLGIAGDQKPTSETRRWTAGDLQINRRSDTTAAADELRCTVHSSMLYNSNQ